MNFGFTEEQDLLRAEVRKWLDDRCPLVEVRKLMASPDAFSPELWASTSELGWPGLTAPERFGGAGLGFVDAVVLFEETGRTLFPSPLLSTTLVATLLRDFASDAARERWLPGLASGREIGSVAWLEASDRHDAAGVALAATRDGAMRLLSGEKRFVPDAATATLFLVPFHDDDGALRIALVPRASAGVSVTRSAALDETKRSGRVRLDAVRVAPDALLTISGDAALAALLDRGAVLTTAEMVGAMEGAHAMLVRYAKERVQFGSPIGRFQGVKHPLAEHHVAIESTKSLLYWAAWTLDEGSPEASLAASRAKAFASEAFSRLGLDAVGLHGGIGYTWEYDAHLFLKRAKWARPAFGDADLHWDRIAALGAR